MNFHTNTAQPSLALGEGGSDGRLCVCFCEGAISIIPLFTYGIQTDSLVLFCFVLLLAYYS